MASSLLVIMGSGELAPTMAKLHREAATRVGARSGVIVATPYAFQENAQELSERSVQYLKESASLEMRVVGLRAVLDAAEVAAIAEAPYVFAGPGSPTYARRKLCESPFVEVVAEALQQGGRCAVFSSAAAITLGTRTLPVYEIYKVGLDPYWEPGLNLLEKLFGIKVVVVPHFDNKEGGTHDTRFCYMGERRLRVLESQLEDEVILGIDEHTAAVIDVSEGVVEVWGKGGLHLRKAGVTHTVPAGAKIGVSEIATAPESATAAQVPSPRPPAEGSPQAPTQLAAERKAISEQIEASLARRDAAGLADSLLKLEGLIHAWRADPTQSDDVDLARVDMHRGILALAEITEGALRLEREVMGPLVERILKLRAELRAKGEYGMADRLREALLASGIEVRDRAEGLSEWHLRH
jgi:cyanophycinase-like exopeptidase